MSATRLDELEAFSEGADLWLFSDLEQSRWAKRLDWYLNFQLLKAKQHKRREPSPQIQAITHHEGVHLPQVTTPSSAPLMIAAEGFVPTLQVVILAESEVEAWLKTAVNIWQQLGTPSIRLFLPAFIEPQAVTKAWPQGANLSLVVESKSAFAPT